MSARAQRWWTSTVLAIWAFLILGLAAYGYFYPHTHTVYNIYALASQRWWAGQDIYLCEGDAYYRYSPLFAIGVTPFAYLPDAWGNALWRVCNGLIFAVGIGAWARRALPGTRTPAELAALSLLVAPLALHSLQNAQANLMMVGATLFGLAAAAQQRWNRAAAWLALATLIKGYPLALALLLTVLYFRRFAVRFAGALALGLALPFAARWPTVVMASYRSWLLHLSESTTIMRERLRSLDHLFFLYGQPLPTRVFLLTQVLAGILVLLLCVIHARRTVDQRQQLTMAFVLFSVWVVLFGPATESCTYVVAAPTVAWLLMDVFARRAAWPQRTVLLASLLMMGPLTTDMAGQTVRNFANQHGSQPIGALLLLGAVLSSVGKPHAVTRSDDSSVDRDPLKAAA
jgi:hypothetical protein